MKNPRFDAGNGQAGTFGGLLVDESLKLAE
jgi:hypothetical protein